MNNKNLIVTTLCIITATAAGMIALNDNTPHKYVRFKGEKFKVSQYDGQTIVSAYNHSTRREMIDIDCNDTLDSYLIKTNADRFNSVPHTITGKDIPQSIQNEYRQIMDIYRRSQ